MLSLFMDELKFWILPRTNKTKNASRYAEIAGMWKAGMVMEDIASRYGVSRQRIQQILKKRGLEREDGGQAIEKFRRAHDIVAKQKEDEAVKEAKCRLQWGMSLTEYREHVREWGNSGKQGSPLHRFSLQRKSAIYNRKIGWELSFTDWWKIWEESGKWNQRGRGKGYGMSRYGDSGPYSKDNVYICTSGQNFSDSYLVHSTKSRVFKRGMAKRGYWYDRGHYVVTVGSEFVGRFKNAKDARAAYEKRWAEKYAPSKIIMGMTPQRVQQIVKAGNGG